MTNPLGTETRPLRCAIIGAGPSGFYAAGFLLQQQDVHVHVDMFDRLPAPFGLVRYGVAPDHQKIKSVTKIYNRTASDPRFRFYGNIDFGADISRDDLHRHYDQIIYAVGAQSDRRLNIPGEDSEGSISATEFVAWYNGHPDFADLDMNLQCETAIVVGVGNVAMDVARILAKTVDELYETDITDYALEKLKTSRIKDIYVFARRGPAQAKFTNPEIREFGELADADVVVKESELLLDPLSEQEIANDSVSKRNMDILQGFAQRSLTGKTRRVHFRFLVSPVEIFPDDSGRVHAVKLEENCLKPTDTGYLNSHGTGVFETIEAGLVMHLVGYKGIPLQDVPYDTRRGTIPNRNGRVYDPETDTQVMGEYVVGWAKRGPSGVIGTNKPDAVETAENMLADLPQTPPADDPDPAAIEDLLRKRELRFVSIDDWRRLDQMEIDRGEERGRTRVKFTHVQEMLDALESDVPIEASI